MDPTRVFLDFGLRERLCWGQNLRPLTIFLHLHHNPFWVCISSLQQLLLFSLGYMLLFFVTE